MDEAEFRDFPKLLSGGAYEKNEVRTGPPLDYVAEKLRRSLESAHSTFALIEKYVLEDVPPPEEAVGRAFSTRHNGLNGLVAPAHGAFHYALVAYLALNNMLGAYTPDLANLLLQMSYEEFGRWLNRIDEVGLVAE